MKWFTDFERLKTKYGPDLTVHGALIAVAMFATSFTEARLTGSVSPVHPLFFLIILSLDRAVDFVPLDNPGQS
jgi:uncharacterized membrane protein